MTDRPDQPRENDPSAGPAGDEELPAYARTGVTDSSGSSAGDQADHERTGDGSQLGADGSPTGPGTLRGPGGTHRPAGEAPGVTTPRRNAVMILLAGLIGAVLGTAGTLALARTDTNQAQGVAPRVVTAEGPTDDGGVVAVAKAVRPSVVRINRLQIEGGVPQPEGLGSGVVYRQDGYVVTNNHVVEGAEQLEVMLAEGGSAPAEVVGTDPLTDLAVLKIDRNGLPAITVRSDLPPVGARAVAIGSPFGLNASVTAGVVSALNRNLEIPLGDGVQAGVISIPEVIQTDAAINPGNSGGALVDGRGRLIGINTAIANPAQIPGAPPGNVGIGFAVSSPTVVKIADTLIADGEVHHARLGITGGDVSAGAIRQFNLSVNQGAVVAKVDPDGPAAGVLQPGDVIVTIGDQPVEGFDDLVVQVRQHKPGETIQLTIVRGGAKRQVEVTLGEFDV